jgi:hypothetical protein
MQITRFLTIAMLFFLNSRPHLNGAEWNLDLDIKMEEDLHGWTNVDSYAYAETAELGSAAVMFSLSPVLSGRTETGSAIGQFDVGGFIRNNDYGFNLTGNIGGNADFVTTTVGLTFQSNDAWHLVARVPNTPLPTLSLNGNFVASATASASGPNIFFGGQPVTYEVNAGFNLQSVALKNDFLFEGGTASLNQALVAQFSQGGQSQGEFSISLKSTFFFYGPYQVDLDASHTFALESMTFEDGKTPEEYGFDIIFDSGRLSPNIVVPEPATFTTLSLGIALAAWHRRRWRLL